MILESNGKSPEILFKNQMVLELGLPGEKVIKCHGIQCCMDVGCAQILQCGAMSIPITWLCSLPVSSLCITLCSGVSYIVHLLNLALRVILFGPLL